MGILAAGVSSISQLQAHTTRPTAVSGGTPQNPNSSPGRFYSSTSWGLGKAMLGCIVLFEHMGLCILCSYLVEVLKITGYGGLG